MTSDLHPEVHAIVKLIAYNVVICLYSTYLKTHYEFKIDS